MVTLEVPAALLRLLLNEAARADRPFTSDEQRLDVAADLAAGEVRSYRAYAARWGCSKRHAEGVVLAVTKRPKDESKVRCVAQDAGQSGTERDKAGQEDAFKGDSGPVLGQSGTERDKAGTGGTEGGPDGASDAVGGTIPERVIAADPLPLPSPPRTPPLPAPVPVGETGARVHAHEAGEPAGETPAAAKRRAASEARKARLAAEADARRAERARRDEAARVEREAKAARAKADKERRKREAEALEAHIAVGIAKRILGRSSVPRVMCEAIAAAVPLASPPPPRGSPAAADETRRLRLWSEALREYGLKYGFLDTTKLLPFYYAKLEPHERPEGALVAPSGAGTEARRGLGRLSFGGGRTRDVSDPASDFDIYASASPAPDGGL